MGNNLTPYSIAIGWENIYFLTPYFRVIKKENIDVDNIDKLFDINYDDITSREKIEKIKFIQIMIKIFLYINEFRDKFNNRYFKLY